MEIGICVVAFLFLWIAFMPWWLAAITVFVGWSLVKGGLKSNPFDGIGKAVGGAAGALKRLAISLTVFAIALLGFNRVLGIGSFAVMDELKRLGPFFWAWPANIQLPLIMYMFGATLLFGGAITVAWGNWKPAKIFFGAGFVLVAMMYFAPNTLSTIVPTEKDPTTGVVSPSAKGIDTAIAERGLAPVAGDTAWRLGLGKPDPQHGAVGGSALRFWTWAFGPPAPPSPAGSRTTSAPARAPRVVVKVGGKIPTMHLFGPNGCYEEKIHVHDWAWYPKGGRVTVFPPQGPSFIDTPGVDIATHRGPGEWKWCQLDATAIGVEIWQ